MSSIFSRSQKLVGFAAFLLCTSGDVFGYSFRGLSDLAGGNFDSRGNDVSSDGSVVVGFATSSNGFEGYRWTSEGGIVGLGALDETVFESSAAAVSSDGSTVVGRSRTPTGFEAFRWRSGEGMVSLKNLPLGSSSMLSAVDISGDGTVIVGLGSQASRWSETDGLTMLGSLQGGSTYSQANGISEDGSVVVGQASSGYQETEAFRWSSSTGMQGIGDFSGGSFTSTAFAASSDGSIVVGYGTSSNGQEAFRWTEEGGLLGLGDLPGDPFGSMAFGVSGDGTIVVGRSIPDSGNAEAFIWDEVNGMRNLRDVLVSDFGLDLTGWVLSEAYAISSNGWYVVGYGVNPLGQTEAWLARIVPPPPEIITHPQSQDVTEGTQVTLSVSATGAGTLSYQWLVGSTVLAEGPESSLELENVQLAQSGTYKVIVASEYGSVESNDAILNVIPVPPAIVTHPPSQTVVEGDDVIFTVSATGSGQLTYEWLLGENQVAIGPAPSLTLENVQFSQAGSYTVIVSNAGGSAESDSALLNVILTTFDLRVDGVGSVEILPPKSVYALGEPVTLEAIPGRWHELSQWGDSVTENPRTVSIGANGNFSNQYTAVFTPVTELETLNIDGVVREAPIGMPAAVVDGGFIIDPSFAVFAPVTAVLSTSFENGAIFYSLDGSAPGSLSDRYETPLTIENTVTLRAIAYSADFLDSWEMDAIQIQVRVSDPFTELPNLGGHWRASPWFGFVNTSFSPWVFHLQHQWLFHVFRPAEREIFFYDLASTDWWFTSEQLYPNLFSFDRGRWIFYFFETATPRKFVELETGEFFSLP